MNQAVFLDRDGTLSYDTHYLAAPDRLKLYKSTIPALSLLQSHTFKIIVVTNQSGIARGIFSESTLHSIHQRLTQLLKKNQVRLDDIYFCPHHPDQHCDCRKPKAALFYQAVREHQLNLSASFMIGDSVCDIEAGLTIGCQTILVLTGRGRQTLQIIRRKKALSRLPHFIAPHLLAAAQWIARQKPPVAKATATAPTPFSPSLERQNDIPTTV